MNTEDTLNAMEVGEWLADKGRREVPVGLAMVEGWVKLAAEDEARSLPVGTIGGSVLKQALTATWPVSLVVRSRVSEAVALSALTDLDPGYVAERIVGDTYNIERTTGDEQPTTPAEMVAAYRLATGMSGLPQYYRTIAEPYSKIQCGRVEGGVPVTVKYRNLLAKVIAHGSNEPVLNRSNELDDPAENVQELLALDFEDVKPDHGYNVLVYAGIGLKKIPAGFLPSDDPDRMTAWLEKTMPVLVSTTTGYFLNSMQRGTCETLYGRKMKVNGASTAAQIMGHMYAGTVQDIIEVACVSLHNSGVQVVAPTYRDWDRVITIKGSFPKEDIAQWIKQIKGIASLLHPLGLQLLNPEVTYD